MSSSRLDSQSQSLLASEFYVSDKEHAVVIGEKIDEGTFTIVYKASFQGKEIAVKKLKHQRDTLSYQSAARVLEEEARTLKKLTALN